MAFILVRDADNIVLRAQTVAGGAGAGETEFDENPPSGGFTPTVTEVEWERTGVDTYSKTGNPSEFDVDTDALVTEGSTNVFTADNCFTITDTTGLRTERDTGGDKFGFFRDPNGNVVGLQFGLPNDTGLGGFLRYMASANFPQFFMGYNTSTGKAFIDADNGMELGLNNLDAGKVVVGNGLNPETDDATDIGEALLTWRNLFLGTRVVAGEPSAFRAVDTVGGLVLTGTFATLPLDAPALSQPSGVFTEASDEVTINEAGTFVISYWASTTITLGSARSQSEAKLQVDTGGGFTDVPGTLLSMYNRLLTRGENSVGLTLPIVVTSGDIFRVQIRQESGADTVTTKADGSGLAIWRAC